MNRLKESDTIKLSGGYDYDPPWLKSMKRRKDHFRATVLRFFDNQIAERKEDERLSAAIEFDEIVDFEGLKGKYGFIMGRWEGQKWETSGVVHVHLTNKEIFEASNITKDDSRWMESHASYKMIDV